VSVRVKELDARIRLPWAQGLRARVMGLRVRERGRGGSSEGKWLITNTIIS
jgi:hypothetical protein